MHPLGTRELEPSGRLGGSGLLTNTIGNPLETTIALSHLIFEGTLDRFPGLKICAAHGGGFLPSYANRSDAVIRCFPDRVGPLPKKKPTAYLKDGQLFFDTIVFTPEALRHLIAETGPGQIMIGTDYPFPWTSTEVDLVLNTPGLNDDAAHRHPGRHRGAAARHLLSRINRGKHMELKGTVAVVTGGNGGLGQRICHALAAQGCHIAVVYAQSKDQAAGVARDLEKHQVGAAAFACDVTQRDQVQKMVDDVVKRFGRLDILVNDAAYNKSIPFKDLDNLTYEEWTKIIDINLTGPMLVTKAVAPVMKRQGSGRIVNISSVAGLGPSGSSIAYAVSKAGLIHLTKCMAVALAPEVLVNCVAPGLLEGTRATANLRPEQVETGRKGSLLGKAADKDDCADQVVTMCRTNTMTGQTLVIDSGRTFH